MVEHQTPNLGSGVTYRPPDTHGYPGGGGVVFTKDPGQLESRSVSVGSSFSDQHMGRFKEEVSGDVSRGDLSRIRSDSTLLRLCRINMFLNWKN